MCGESHHKLPEMWKAFPCHDVCVWGWDPYQTLYMLYKGYEVCTPKKLNFPPAMYCQKPSVENTSLPKICKEPVKRRSVWSVFSAYRRICLTAHLAPVPLTIFRSNSKFDQNLQCSSLKCTLPTTKKFCTCHDSVTVVTCAKFRCERLSRFETRALPILIEFRIRSKYR